MSMRLTGNDTNLRSTSSSEEIASNGRRGQSSQEAGSFQELPTHRNSYQDVSTRPIKPSSFKKATVNSSTLTSSEKIYGDTHINGTSVQQMGYRLLIAKTKTELSEKQEGMLDTAQKAVDKTRSMHDYGRGNILSDNVQTNNETALRSYNAENITHQLISPKTIESEASTSTINHDFAAMTAAVADAEQSGVCRQKAASTYVEIARNGLQTDESVRIIFNATVGHAFTVLSDRKEKESSRKVVADAWAYGPAILAEHSKFLNPRHHILTLSLLENNDQAQRMGRMYETFRTQASTTALETERSKHKASENLYPQYQKMSSVLSKKFREEATESIANLSSSPLVSGVMDDLLATAAFILEKHAHVSSETELVRLAPRVVDAALMLLEEPIK
jgi:hypothetical protein